MSGPRPTAPRPPRRAPIAPSGALPVRLLDRCRTSPRTGSGGPARSSLVRVRRFLVVSVAALALWSCGDPGGTKLRVEAPAAQVAPPEAVPVSSTSVTPARASRTLRGLRPDLTTSTRPSAPRPPTDRVGHGYGPPSTAVAPQPRSTEGRSIGSSAYCLRGRMANGRQVHPGAVASVVLPMGSRWRVTSGGGLVGQVFTVEDTGGPRATFDVWMPSCPAAIRFGRPTLRIEPA